MKNIFKKIFFSVLVTCLFISCSDFSNSDSSFVTNEKGRIIISTNLDSYSRSVLPTGITEQTQGLTWELVGTCAGKTYSKIWNDKTSEDGSVTLSAYNNMISDNGLLLDVGTWSFSLKVRNDNGYVLVGTTQVAINSGENTLSFEMNEATSDDLADGETIASGSISFTLKFPEGVDKVVSKLISHNNNVVADTKAYYLNSGTTETSVTCEFSGQTVSAGYYILQIDLQQNTGDTTAPNYQTINTYTCLVRVAPGLCSKGEYTLNSLAKLYTITYECNRGNFGTETITTSYNEYTSFELPTPTREGFTFAGWYTDETYDTPASNGGTYKISSDTTVYAKWIKNVEGITHANNTLYISSYEGLKVFRDIVNGSLADDITISGDAANSGENVSYLKANSVTNCNVVLESDIRIDEDWTPIGVYASSQVPYVGTFNGNNKTITFGDSVKVNSQAAGLFGAISSGCNIYNLIIDGNIQSSIDSSLYAGGIVGFANGGSVQNCVNKAKIQNASSAGGIAGNVQNTSFIGCVNFGEIIGTHYSAGIVGAAAANTSINLCVNIGNISSTTACGISGDALSNIIVQNCINLGTLSATNNIYGIASGSGDIKYNISAGKFESTVENSCYAVCSSATDTNYYDNSICSASNFNIGSAEGKTTSDFSNLSLDELAWSAAEGRYPLPNISENVDAGIQAIPHEIWNAIYNAAAISVSEPIEGTPVADFTSLSSAFSNAPTDGTETVIVLQNDISIASYINIESGKNIKIISNKDVTIYRGSSVTGSFFTVNSGATLTLGGSDYKITLDGRTSNTETEGISASYPFVKQQGNLYVENCVMQYNKHASSSVNGGAIYSEGNTTIKNSTFNHNNYTYSNTTKGCGGAIYILNSNSVSIEGCTFNNNQAYQRGGAIYVGGSANNEVQISNCTFSNNFVTNDTGRGGAICVSNSGGTVTFKNLTLNNNYVVQNSSVEDIAYNGGSSTTQNMGNIDCSNIYVSNGYTLNVVEQINSDNVIKLTFEGYDSSTAPKIIYNSYANDSNFFLADSAYSLNNGVVVSGGGE